MKNLALLRKQAHLSQQELGNKIGLARNTICQYECGSRIPETSTLILLANFFNVSTDYLLDRQSPTASPLTETQQTLLDKVQTLSEEQANLLLSVINSLK